MKARKAIGGGRRTTYRTTAKGRGAFERHIAALERVVSPAGPTSGPRRSAAGRAV